MKPEPNETLTHYLNQAGSQTRLTPEQEKTATPEQLMSANLLLVVHIAKSYSRDTEELLDTIQDGNEGLIIAAHRYEPERGLFSVCASYHIRNRIREARLKTSQLVRLPKPIFNAMSDIKLLSKEGLTVDQIAKTLDVPAASVKAALSYAEESIPEHQDHNDSPLRELSDQPNNNPAVTVDGELVKRLAQRMMTERQYNIVMRRFEGYTAVELSKEYGVSHQAISFQEKQGLARLAQ